MGRPTHCLAIQTSNVAQPLPAWLRPIPSSSPCWPTPLPITTTGCRVQAEALLAEWPRAEVRVPSPWLPCLRVQTQAVAVLLGSQQGCGGGREASWVLGPPLL